VPDFQFHTWKRGEPECAEFPISESGAVFRVIKTDEIGIGVHFFDEGDYEIAQLQIFNRGKEQKLIDPLSTRLFVAGDGFDLEPLPPLLSETPPVACRMSFLKIVRGLLTGLAVPRNGALAKKMLWPGKGVCGVVLFEKRKFERALFQIFINDTVYQFALAGS
jgi:hypothetical protein